MRFFEFSVCNLFDIDLDFIIEKFADGHIKLREEYLIILIGVFNISTKSNYV